MRAKEYLNTYQKLIFHFDIISQIMEDLSKMRHDMDATISYYKLYLMADMRYYEWETLGQKHGYAGVVDPKEFKHDDEIDRRIVSNVRDGLLEVVKEDKSFGYITCLLSKQSITEETSLEVEQALKKENKACEQEKCYEDMKSEESNNRTMKVTTDVLIKILDLAGIRKGNNADGTKIAKLISYLTGYSSNTIRIRLSSKEELTKSHEAEVEKINQLLKELSTEITITYNKYR